MSETATTPTPKTYPAALQMILQRANAGDTSVLPQLREALERYPELVERFGDLAKHAEDALIELASGGSLVAQEAIRQKMTALRERLLATVTTPLEELLVDRLVLCSLEATHGDVDLAQHLVQQLGAAPATQAAERRLDRAHQRFLAAARTLGVVQKLLTRGPTPLELLTRPLPEKSASARSARGPASVNRLAGVTVEG